MTVAVAAARPRGYEDGDIDPEQPVTVWEYATAPLISHALQEILNQWGEDGWELVTVVQAETGLTAYFKRPKEG